MYNWSLNPFSDSASDSVSASASASDSDSDIDSIPDLEYYRMGHPLGSEPILFDFIAEDNKQAFVQRIKYGLVRSEYYRDWYQSQELITEILLRISIANAIRCATALLAGKTGLGVDINDLDPYMGAPPNPLHSDPYIGVGPNPLHFTFTPELVKLYIRKGARTDIRFGGMLPLNKTLEYLRSMLLGERVDWSSKQSISMVIVLLCLKYLDILESVKLLFDNTKEVVKEVYDYLKGGKLLETTFLLMVAREKIMSPLFFEDFTSSGSMSLHQLVLLEIESLKASQTKLDSAHEEIQEQRNKLETMNSILHLIEVLESVGPEIDQYRQRLPKLSMGELATKVAYLLISKGFVEYEDLKRSVSGKTLPGKTLPTSHQHFLILLGIKLHGEIEGSHLESKDVAGTMEHADMLEENNSPVEEVETNYELQIKQHADMLEENNSPVEAVETNYELQIKQLKMELEKERKLNEYFQEELKFLKLDNEKTFTELSKLCCELNGKIVEISSLQTELNRPEDESGDDTVTNLKRLIVALLKENTHLKMEKNKHEPVLESSKKCLTGKIDPNASQTLDADEHAELSKREEEEIFVSLSQTERAVAEGKAKVNKLDEDNGKLKRTLEDNMTRFNTMSMDSD